MNQQEKANAITFIRPGAEFVLRGPDVEWMDKAQTEPTEQEIETGWLAYQAAQIAEAEAKAAEKAALLNRLGITEDEAKLLLA
jgi:hypothetical protein